RARSALGRFPLGRPGREPDARGRFASRAAVRGRRGRAAAHGARPGRALEIRRGSRRAGGRALGALGEGGARRSADEAGHGGSIGGRFRPAWRTPRRARTNRDAYAIHLVTGRLSLLTP